MRIVQYDSSTNKFTEPIMGEPLDLSKGDQVIILGTSPPGSRTTDFVTLDNIGADSATLSRKEMELLIQCCGFKNIRSGKVSIFTPKLFLMDRMAQKSGQLFLKLGSLCFVGDANGVREMPFVESLQAFGKYFDRENILVREE